MMRVVTLVHETNKLNSSSVERQVHGLKLQARLKQNHKEVE